MDMDRLPYRSLYSAILLLGATPIFDCNSVYAVPAGQRAPGTVRCPGTLGFSITPHLTSCFYKDALATILETFALIIGTVMRRPVHP
jgi:hypothetical protein